MARPATRFRLGDRKRQQARAIGRWVICGDLPTDYINGRDAQDPREAVREFARRWSEAAAPMREGRSPDDVRIASTAEARRRLAPILKSRASLLQKWADRDDVWEDLFDEDEDR